MSRKPHILCIAPYEGMKEIMLNIASRRSDIAMSIYLGDREEGVRILRESTERDVDAVISRGITADLIAASSSIPISRIVFSIYDILRAIKTAQTLDDHFAIIGLPEVADCARLLCDTLRYGYINIVTIHAQDETDAALLRLKKEGYALIVGDLYTVSRAQRIALRGILIVSGIESIEDAIDRAKHVIALNRTAESRLALYRHALESLPVKTVLFNDEGESVFSSLSADDMSVLLPRFRAVMPRLFEEEALQFSVNGDQKLYRVAGRVLHEQETRYCVFQTETSEKSAFDVSRAVAYYSYDSLDTPPYFFGSRSAESLRFQELVNQYAQAARPFLLIGETGANIDGIAAHLYRNGQWRNGSFVLLDASVCSAKNWDYFLESSNSPIYGHNVTIHIKGFDCLTREQGAQLFLCLESTKSVNRVRVILSCNLTNRLRTDDLYERYPSLLTRFITLRLPSLREHPEDIWELSNFYINELSLEYGRHVIGLTPEAGALLQAYTWPQNDAQLRKTLMQAMLLTDKSYISGEEISAVMNQEPSFSAESAGAPAVDLGKPLKDIEHDIVSFVLEREGMNQSRAAKRLGISRSTIWRILNK